MAFSYVDLVASAGQQNFAFNIPYLNQNDVSVFKNGIVLTPVTDWTFLMAQVARLTVGAALNDVIRVRRFTPIAEPIVDYSNGSVLGEKDLDSTALQSLFAAQEVADDASNTIHADASLRWDALGRRIINVGTPTAAGDAVNKEFADDIVENAEAAAAAASASASAASASAAQLIGTSTTSLLITVASKDFTTQAGKFFAAGTALLITSNANPANFMHGHSTAYSGTSLTVNVTNIGGSGTFADWTIRVSGTRGATGEGLGDHVAASDPHTQYQKENEKDIALGYAGLDSNGELSRALCVDTAALAAGAVTYEKLQAAGGASKLIGTPSTGNYPYQEITLGTNLSMSGGTLNAAPGLLTVEQFGAIGDDATDDTAAIQAAIDNAEAVGGAYIVKLGNKTYRLASSLTIDKPIALVGVGVSPYTTAPGTRGNGSWLHFDHAGKGIVVDGTGPLSGVTFDNFGTFRTQPTPGAAWAPTAFDYDIWIDNADVYIPDLLLLNPTKGIFVGNGDYGRLEIERLRGQAFDVMVDIDESFDVVKINNFHQWPFWADDANVHAYTRLNLAAIRMARCDNPQLTNIFTIFANAGLRFIQDAGGKTSKVHLVNADFDRGIYAIYVDSTVTDGVTGQFANVSHFADTGAANSVALLIAGNNSLLEFANFNSTLTDKNAVRVEGTGNIVDLNGKLSLTNYDQSVGNFPAIEVLTGNKVRIGGLPTISGGGGSGGKYGGAGLIYVDDWRTYTPTVTSVTGTITTVGAVIAKFKRIANTLVIALDIIITTNGTGATAVRATLPDAIVTSTRVANGREIVNSGVTLQGTLISGTSQVDILTYANAYPAVDGSRLIINGQYEIA